MIAYVYIGYNRRTALHHLNCTAELKHSKSEPRVHQERTRSKPGAYCNQTSFFTTCTCTNLYNSLLYFLQGKKLLLVRGDEEQAGGRVAREVRDVGVEETSVVELGETYRSPALCRSEGYKVHLSLDNGQRTL